jgi:hypothetical protein
MFYSYIMHQAVHILITSESSVIVPYNMHSKEGKVHILTWKSPKRSCIFTENSDIDTIKSTIARHYIICFGFISLHFKMRTYLHSSISLSSCFFFSLCTHLQYNTLKSVWKVSIFSLIHLNWVWKTGVICFRFYVQESVHIHLPLVHRQVFKKTLTHFASKHTSNILRKL